MGSAIVRADSFVAGGGAGQALISELDAADAGRLGAGQGHRA